ncbi:helix-turn-helix domain-containing protein [Streptosporangium sp. NPDC049644]|uniref:helix-turn-helix domain-containing protein n=1 Tax=Streptosporangium sp. NPDC049644 TaxID=3155507 RepID=UPI003416887A
MSVVEQRYHAVIEVLSGAKVTDVAERYGISRQSVHTWVRRYRGGGLGALADRSHRVRAHPMQTPAATKPLYGCTGCGATSTSPINYNHPKSSR